MSDGTANRLKESASAYLRSAAHQPIDWHEWGEEVFARARAEDKPILLDIGAVWCHWCHVIDRESYENPQIAAVIREHFVAVKVDRDERPDVDARYQAAISAISGQGGWPLTGFLTPDGMPFFGGTYFPPEDAMGRPGFKRILLAMAEAYQTRRADVNRSAEALRDAVSQAETFRGARGDFDPRVAGEIVDSAVRMYDLRNGGFGRSPKFPHPAALDLILECYQTGGEQALRSVAETSLEKMARGGVYDQLAGGFHRYSVDERWLVPHFEKMSYDNSELLKNYVHGFQVTGNLLLRHTAEGIITWVDQVLSDRARGGFYASQDADYSLDDDGDYFTWTLEELRAALLPEEAQVMELHYDVGAAGEMHHNPAKNVLWMAREAAEIAGKTGRTDEEVKRIIARGREKMLAARLPRPTPYVDPTLYVSWNAMFASAYLDAARVLGRDECRAFALKTLDRILAEAWDPERGFAHRFGAQASAGWLPGSLDDQVCTALAMLDAFEVTLSAKYFEIAEKTLQILLEKYADSGSGGFFDRATDAPALGGLDVPRKPIQDSPTPGSNSLAAIALDRMYGFTGEAKYQKAARQTLEAFAGIAGQFGLFAASYGLAAVLHARHTLQVVVTGEAEDPLAASLEAAACQVYRFGKAVLRITPESLARNPLPAGLAQTLPPLCAGVPRALVCIGTSCHPPVEDPAQLKAMLCGLSAGAATV